MKTNRQKHIVQMDAEKLKGITKPLSEAVNAAQAEGYTIDEVLLGMMIMLGTAIKQRGATLLIDAPLREALPPIVIGYEMDYDDVPGGLKSLSAKYN